MRREDAYGGFEFFSLPAELSSNGVEVLSFSSAVTNFSILF